MNSLPVVLSIAGSDNSAGAGAQADLKTFSALGVYGTTAITCVVAEVPGQVAAIQAIEPEIVAEQIRLTFSAFPVAAVKTGMLYSRAIIEEVATALEKYFARTSNRPPLVIDPVMVATSGDALLEPDAVEMYRRRLFPMSTIITPNLDEAGALLERAIGDLDGVRAAARELSGRFGTAVLLKGGHLREAVATDVLVAAGEMHEFSAPFVPGVATHGTGCTYSAAIAAGLADGRPLVDAVARAKRFVTSAIGGFLRWQSERGPTDALHHFAGIRTGME